MKITVKASRHWDHQRVVIKHFSNIADAMLFRDICIDSGFREAIIIQ